MKTQDKRHYIKSWKTVSGRGNSLLFLRGSEQFLTSPLICSTDMMHVGERRAATFTETMFIPLLRSNNFLYHPNGDDKTHGRLKTASTHNTRHIFIATRLHNAPENVLFRRRELLLQRSLNIFIDEFGFGVTHTGRHSSRLHNATRQHWKTPLSDFTHKDSIPAWLHFPLNTPAQITRRY